MTHKPALIFTLDIIMALQIECGKLETSVVDETVW